MSDYGISDFSDFTDFKYFIYAVKDFTFFSRSITQLRALN